jgi:hypothetical protein
MSVVANKCSVQSEQIVVNIDGTILIGRPDESLEYTLISTRYFALVAHEPGFINSGCRRVVPGMARISITGTATPFARYVEMAALYGPDVLVGRDLLSTIRASTSHSSRFSQLSAKSADSSPSDADSRNALMWSRKLSGTPLRLAISNRS